MKNPGGMVLACLALMGVAACEMSARVRERPSRASVGKPCATEGKVSCLGSAEALVCVDGKYEAISCRAAPCSGGPDEERCSSLTHLENEYCDVGAADDESSKHACSVDGTTQLRCVGKRWQREKPCPGALGCRRVHLRTECDGS